MPFNERYSPPASGSVPNIPRFVKKPRNLPQENNPEAMRKQLEDPTFLPSHEFVEKAFTEEAVPRKGNRIDRHAFFTFCEGGRRDRKGQEIFVHEILTRELIVALADHFSELIHERLLDNPTKPFVLLEVGAGDGRLAGFLRRELQSRFGDHVHVEATDAYSEGATPEFKVINMDYKTALDTYHPDAVLSSWMPPGEDWTKDFRQPDRDVQEYVLIGEPEEGISGTMDTWDEDLIDADGFDMTVLDEATMAQISHTDHQLDRRQKGAISFSKTMVFKKEE